MHCGIPKIVDVVEAVRSKRVKVDEARAAVAEMRATAPRPVAQDAETLRTVLRAAAAKHVGAKLPVIATLADLERFVTDAGAMAYLMRAAGVV